MLGPLAHANGRLKLIQGRMQVILLLLLLVLLLLLLWLGCCCCYCGGLVGQMKREQIASPASPSPWPYPSLASGGSGSSAGLE